jgi:hypothetical protein
MHFKAAYNTNMTGLADSNASQLATLPVHINGISYYFGYQGYSGIYGSKLCVADVDELLYNIVPYDTTTLNEYKNGNELMGNMTITPMYNLKNLFYEVMLY